MAADSVSIRLQSEKLSLGMFDRNRQIYIILSLEPLNTQRGWDADLSTSNTRFLFYTKHLFNLQ